MELSQCASAQQSVLNQVESWQELVQAHDRFVNDYNAQRHCAHRG
jgi:hypothetical protein